MLETQSLRTRFIIKPVLWLILVILADWLFYRHAIGWTLALFNAALLCSVLFTHKNLLRTMHGKIIAMLTGLLLVAQVNAVDILPTAMFYAGIAALHVLHRRKAFLSGAFIQDTLRILPNSIFRGKKDLNAIDRVAAKKRIKIKPQNFVLYFVPPFLLSLAFLFFFSEANPLLKGIFDWVNIDILRDLISFGRLIFWIFTGMIIWSFLRPRLKMAVPKNKRMPLPANMDAWFSKNSVVISLVIFNALFAFQNVMDVAFLWSGQALPDGLTYAKYAQSGAYPLVFTILLAAGYVLLVYDDAQKKLQTPAIKALTLVWIGQNMFLAASAFNRAVQYVEAYSLTYMRLSALVWMSLVVVGLLLITAKICLNRRNAWLVNSNVIILTAVLYGSCFINFDRIVANYNVRHAYETTGTGVRLDMSYMKELGPEALPALFWFEKHSASNAFNRDVFASVKSTLHSRLIVTTGRSAEGWRAWQWQASRTLAEIEQLEQAAIAPTAQ